MPQKINKKIFLYIFLFFLIGSVNNKNFNNFEYPKIKQVYISGLSDTETLELRTNLDFLKFDNLFLLNKLEIIKKLGENNLIEKYSIFKIYPSTLKINITKTKILARAKNVDDFFYLGSNGKVIKVDIDEKNIPFIFGKFEIKEFFELKKVIDESKLNYFEIKNLFFFNSGRWDVETNSGILIKLPKHGVKKALELYNSVLRKEEFKNIKEIDLRQSNQIIINGK